MEVDQPRLAFVKTWATQINESLSTQSDLKNTKVRRRYRYLSKVDLVDANLLETTKSEGEDDLQNKGGWRISKQKKISEHEELGTLPFRFSSIANEVD